MQSEHLKAMRAISKIKEQIAKEAQDTRDAKTVESPESVEGNQGVECRPRPRRNYLFGVILATGVMLALAYTGYVGWLRYGSAEGVARPVARALGQSVGFLVLCAVLGMIPRKENPRRKWVIFAPLFAFWCVYTAYPDHKVAINHKKELTEKDFVAVDEPQTAIIDPDYCFRIDSPGDRWKLFSERGAVRIVPDALAGAIEVGGLHGVVIVEPLPDCDLAEYVNLLRDVNRVPGGELTPIRETTFQAKPALRYGQSATVNGVELRVEYVVFLHQGFGYQLTTLAVAGRYSDSAAQTFLGAFHLTDGKVRARSGMVPTNDFEGVGQRVIDGRFESAVYKLAVDPPKGWHLMVGASLWEANEDAEIGLSNASLGAYLVVVPEYIWGTDREAHRKLLLASIEAESGIDTGARRALEPLPMIVGGDSVDFRRHIETISATSFRFYTGVYFVGTCCYQILAWHFEGNESPPEAELAQAVKSIRFLDDERVEQLTSEMRDKPDPENSIGPGYCLRNGVYRNFEHGVTWTKPRGFWRAATGDEARSQNEAVSLLAVEPQSGLYVQWIVEEAGAFDDATLHQAALTGMFGGGHPVLDRMPESLVLAGATALVSEANFMIDGVMLAFRVATTIANGRAHQMIVWGLPGNMERGRQQGDQALLGFAFPGSSLVEVVKTPLAYRDNRAGFYFSVPGPGWTVNENLRPDLRPVGTTIQFLRGGQEVLVSALATFEPGPDKSFVYDNAAAFLEVNFSRLMSSIPMTKSASFAGISWRVQVWRQGGESVHAAVGERHSTFYMLLVADTKGTGDRLMNHVMKNFQLLD